MNLEELKDFVGTTVTKIASVTSKQERATITLNLKPTIETGRRIGSANDMKVDFDRVETIDLNVTIIIERG
jgi:hypothetical protein